MKQVHENNITLLPDVCLSFIIMLVIHSTVRFCEIQWDIWSVDYTSADMLITVIKIYMWKLLSSSSWSPTALDRHYTWKKCKEKIQTDYKHILSFSHKVPTYHFKWPQIEIHVAESMIYISIFNDICTCTDYIHVHVYI